MIAAIDPLVGIIAAVVIPALGTYLLTARKLSGKIGSSDASELWQESRSMRVELTTQVATLTARIARVEQQNADLSSSNTNLVQQIRDLSELLGAARKEIVDLTKELRSANERVAQLEQEAGPDAR